MPCCSQAEQRRGLTAGLHRASEKGGARARAERERESTRETLVRLKHLEEQPLKVFPPPFFPFFFGEQQKACFIRNNMRV